MNLLRRTMEILGFETANTTGKKGHLASRRLRSYRQTRARQLLFEQVEDRSMLSTVSATAMTPTVMEGSGAAIYFTVSPPSSSPITVYYRTVAGTATENDDYLGVTGSAMIGPNGTFASVGINTLTDGTVEPPETFSVTITGVSGATVGTSSVTITINDASPSVMPRVAIAPARGANGAEVSPVEIKNAANSTSGAGYVVMLLNGPVGYSLTIPIKVLGQIPAQGGGAASAANGFATIGVDFSLSADTSVTIPAGSTSVMIDLAVLPDRFVEGPENAIVQLYYPNNVVAPFEIVEGVATVVIQDNDYWDWTSPDRPAEDIEQVTIDPSLGDVSAWSPTYGFVNADSKFTSGGNYKVNPDGLFVALASNWEWYEDGWFFVTTHMDYLRRTLEIDFDFDHLTGKITPRSGSGVEGISQLNAATTDIAFEFAIDNNAVYTKTATVTFKAFAAVGGTITTGHSGAVNAGGKIEPGGVGGSLSGSYSFTHTETSDGGGTAINTEKTFVFTLESQEL